MERIDGLMCCPFCGESLVYTNDGSLEFVYMHPWNDCILSSVGIDNGPIRIWSVQEVKEWNKRAIT